LKFKTEIQFEICPSLLELQPNPSLDETFWAPYSCIPDLLHNWP